MRISSILTTVVGASSASAAVMRIAAASAPWEWSVTGWSAGCARECHYNFNITGDASSTSKPARPSFKAYCGGSGEGSNYRACTPLEETETDYLVLAKLLPSNATTNGTSHKPQIQVSVKFIDLDTPTTWWNYTGKAVASYNQFVAPLMNFTITPDTIYGVA
ncbi:uncharacterized protein F4812DRAFT_95648 [Daldinia caldariorum]|uniref:uncharacterized protein n=1 Tax=Daldinia caldariorum TaxID=326644 RepID=UPI0020085B78|nr:uncharacterized protein F4812DRAFT_95648 [Daldinia caldariorum]KAI1466063.1 hypothetical protein F4812DRAFT_95648 [Daldinia caldariorum]